MSRFPRKKIRKKKKKGERDDYLDGKDAKGSQVPQQVKEGADLDGKQGTLC